MSGSIFSKNVLPTLLAGRSVSKGEWEKIFLGLFRDRLSPTEIKMLILLLAKKGEESNEIGGCLDALRREKPPRCVPFPFLIDVCGTGGDGARTFNISTVSSFVIAGAGAYVAKHGNRAVSSKVGSSDLIEALGIRLDAPFRTMLRGLRECRFAYFHAPFYSPDLSKVQRIRRELRIRTLFNVVGPLANPVELQYQMIGVSNPDWLRPLAEVLNQLRRTRGAVVRAGDGLDELSTRETNDILYVEKGRLRKIRLNPKSFGFSKVKKGDYDGGDLKTNREIALRILEDRLRGPRQEIVLLNSGFALWLTGLVSNVKEGVERARWAVRTGCALGVLQAFRRLTRERMQK